MKALHRVAHISALALFAACGGGPSVGTPAPATDTEWRALRTPAPRALPGAPSVTVLDVTVTGGWAGEVPSGTTLSIGVSELVTAGLMRRQDIDFVERRRFTPAAEAERQGRARPASAPPPGVSRSVDFAVQAAWLAATPGRSSAEVQLVNPTTGVVVGGTRREFDGPVDPVTLGRAIVSAVVELVDAETDRPEWSDPMPPVMNAGGPSGVADRAVTSLLAAVAAEDRWQWEAARRGYQAAAADPDFFEAGILLGRTARLRLGGTLAEN